VAGGDARAADEVGAGGAGRLAGGDTHATTASAVKTTTSLDTPPAYQLLRRTCLRIAGVAGVVEIALRARLYNVAVIGSRCHGKTMLAACLIRDSPRLARTGASDPVQEQVACSEDITAVTAL
jgi:hypothetical protein